MQDETTEPLLRLLAPLLTLGPAVLASFSHRIVAGVLIFIEVRNTGTCFVVAHLIDGMFHGMLRTAPC